MKKISFVLLLLFTVSVTSCGIYGSYGFDYAQLSKIEQGMTLKDVTAILGKPVFRDFDKEGEACTFRAFGMHGWSVVKIWFKEGKVTEMKSYLEETNSSSDKKNCFDGQNNSFDKKEDNSSKIYVSPEGKHYIKTGNVVVTPEGKHIIVH